LAVKSLAEFSEEFSAAPAVDDSHGHHPVDHVRTTRL
jgi:hypothetical protein